MMKLIEKNVQVYKKGSYKNQFKINLKKNKILMYNFQSVAGLLTLARNIFVRTTRLIIVLASVTTRLFIE
ncbi:hypothetical protein BpHYR1_042733 [Brachionus plicatilis]|uniref:Uncharacterized protein n=1 Tax=Brachionus plicatilis TaxID=10195 RepID=A0A3M7QX90_BRAPC|nr:hypothetical protein BpHYR1_042733 [Brachionus plicatilis]